VGRRLYLFDCVEFSARFRCADVAAEVAFLAMDLDHLGHAHLSWEFVDAYVRATGDVGLLPLLDFYKCYRAYVRGKVLSFRLVEPSLDASTRQQITAEAASYFDLARTYADPLRPPVLVVTMGLPASGKTTIARAVAGRLAMVHLSSDVVRKQLIGMRPTSHRVEPFGRQLYSSSMSRRTYAALRRRAGRWLKRGQSVVLDATYGQRRDRVDLRHLAKRSGVQPIVVECCAPEQVLLARLAAREHDATSTSDARVQLWPALRAVYTEPAELLSVSRVDTTRPLEHVVDEVVRLVRGSAEGPAKAA
jgi:predicted kinase